MLLSEAGYEESKHTGCIEAIRRRGLTNISDIITAVVGVYLDLYALNEPCEINHGMCEDFAEDVCSLVPGAEIAAGTTNWAANRDRTSSSCIRDATTIRSVPRGPTTGDHWCR